MQTTNLMNTGWSKMLLMFLMHRSERSHPIKVWVRVSLPHPLILADLLHGQPSAGFQHQHVSDQVLTVCNRRHRWELL